MTEANENALVCRCLDGDRRAFEELVAPYEGPLYNLALRVSGNAADAEDLAQTVLLKAYRKLGSFDRRHRFFSWIYRIMINESLNLVRRRRPVEPLDERIVATQPSPEEAAYLGEVRDAVQSALDEMPAEQRQIVILRHLLQMSHREIGEIYEVPAKTIKSRLFAARRMLARGLERRGLTQA